MATPAPDAVKRLVDRFARDMTEMSDISDRVPSLADRKVFLSGDYKEEQLRAEFLNPFFESLGWDVDNTPDTIRDRNWEASLFSPSFPQVLTRLFRHTGTRLRHTRASRRLRGAVVQSALPAAHGSRLGDDEVGGSSWWPRCVARYRLFSCLPGDIHW